MGTAEGMDKMEAGEIGYHKGALILQYNIGAHYDRHVGISRLHDVTHAVDVSYSLSPYPRG